MDIEGDTYIFPGEGMFEWIFAANIIVVSILGCGMLSVFIVMPLFLKSFLGFMRKKQEIGLVSEENLSKKQHLLRLWGRAIVLGFFISNLAFTLASNEAVVTFILTSEGLEQQIIDYGAVQIPNPPAMIQLIWIMAIPCTLLLVPVWLMLDAGIVSTQKIKGLKFTSINQATARLYKIIKGYAGIGFLYNLIVMLITWALEADLEDGEVSQIINVISQFLSPLIIISATFPLIILLDKGNARIKSRIDKTLAKLDLNKELKSTITFEDK